MDALRQGREAVNEYFVAWEPADIVLYTIGTLFVLWFVKKLIIFCSDLKKNAILLALTVVKAAPGGQAQIRKQTDKLVGKLGEDMQKSLKDVPKYLEIPQQGMKDDEIISFLGGIQKREEEKWKHGHVTGCVYVSDEKATEIINQAFSMFTLSNPLHPDVFPSIRKFEAEIIRMSLNLLHGGEDSCGALTSGGTESILMAMKAYRDSRPDITEPEVIAPLSAHPGFDKASQYFKIKLIHVDVGKDYRADVAAIERAITRNTIALVGSAPCYPHGLIDPIEDLATLAKSRGLGMHVDCCLGGFFLPWLQRSKKSAQYGIPQFDFGVSGVTSISADLHKYGMTPKGTSVVLFSNNELRRKMYFAYTEWSGGIYASPTMAGSRPGALVAGAYASLLYHGQSGYIAAAEGVRETAQKIIKGIQEIPELEIIGEPKAMIVAWTSKKFDVFQLVDAMSRWSLATLQKPPSLHLCLTPRHAKEDIAEEFLKDLRESVKNVQKDPSAYKKKAPLYGMAAEMPERSVIKGFVEGYLDAVLKT